MVTKVMAGHLPEVPVSAALMAEIRVPASNVGPRVSMSSEPTCGLPTDDGGTCWMVAGHPGPCRG